MKVKKIKILMDCIENGTERGINAAFKYDPEPSIQKIKQDVRDAIEHELYENFTFKVE